jgi:2-C-methyl-D-erythritol 4-phosphate cytidylyltransferase
MTSNGHASIYALVPCAGVGQRAQAKGPKQYACVAGKTLVEHTLFALLKVTRVAQVLVVLSPTDTAFETHVPKFGGWVARVGGGSRAVSVVNGLVELLARGAAPTDWVLVHDAARCLVRAQWVNALIDACVDDPVGGLLALPVADTLKRGVNGRVASTLDRAHVWQAQTPQMFRIQALLNALQQAGSGVTDEASAMEAAGFSPRLVVGSMENFKITYPDDFLMAERLFKSAHEDSK